MADDQEDTKYCKNCKRDIAAVNFLMHEVHCHRNIVLCEHCDEPVPRTELEEHFEEYHTPVQCKLCKASVKKEDLDSHNDNECPQRRLKCVYCELEMPQCELQSHLDYCGTRTEMCVKCNKYIMHKDLIQHEQTDCAKQKSQNMSSNSGANNRPEQVNSFAMDELSRMLNEPAFMASGTTRKANSSLSRPNNLRSLQGRGGPTPISTHKNIYGTNRRRPTQNLGKAANQKETKNSSREQRQTHMRQEGGHNSYGNNLDMDHLLAMHLHSDLNEYQNEGSEPTGDGFPASQQNDEELPCEFCDQLFSPVELIHHQSVCNAALFEASSPVTPGSPNDDFALPNNSPRRPTPSTTTRAQPQIVDNLSHLAAQDRLTHTDPDYLHLNGGVDEEILLPCEFCDTLLPDDMLIQHQAVCDRNLQSTPRVLSTGGAIPRSHQNNLRRTTPQAPRSGLGPHSNKNYTRQTKQPTYGSPEYLHDHDRDSPHTRQVHQKNGRLLRRGQTSAYSVGSESYGSRQNTSERRNPREDLDNAYDDGPSPHAPGHNPRIRNNLGQRATEPKYQPRMKEVHKGQQTNSRTVYNSNSYPSRGNNQTNDQGHMPVRRNTKQRNLQPLTREVPLSDEVDDARAASRDNNYQSRRQGSRGGRATRAKKTPARGQGRRHPQGEI